MALLDLLQPLQGGARASQVGTQQEQPDQPSISHCVAAVGLSLLLFVPDVNRLANSGPQEQPDHPLPVGRISVIGAIIGAPPTASKRNIWTSQEQPDEPLVWSRIGVPPTLPAIILPPVTRNVWTITEDSRLPPSWTTWPGPVPPVPTTPISAPFVPTVQEWPDTPPSWAYGNPPPVAVVVITLPGVNRYANSGPAEDPDHQAGMGSVSPGFTKYLVGPLTYFEVDQEAPDHPIGWAKSGVPPTPAIAVLSAVTRNVGTAQENPYFTPGWAAPSVIPVIFPHPAKYAVITQAEQPNEPPTWARIGVPPVTLSRIIAAVTVQEYPDLGYSQIWAGNPPRLAVTPVPPSTGYPVTQQEMPFHPSASSLGAPGPFGNGVALPAVAVYNTLFLSGVDCMFAIPGNPPS